MLVTTRTRGRPTVFEPDTVHKLEQAFAIGCTVEEACSVSGVSRSAYYKRLEDDEQFMDKMERARLYMIIQARHTVAQAVRRGDVKTSMWYLERKCKDEFGKADLLHVRTEPLDDLTDEELYELATRTVRIEKTGLL
jgi:hypothetical protein